MLYNDALLLQGASSLYVLHSLLFFDFKHLHLTVAYLTILVNVLLIHLLLNGLLLIWIILFLLFPGLFSWLELLPNRIQVLLDLDIVGAITSDERASRNFKFFTVFDIFL